jgi:hypothetical protein
MGLRAVAAIPFSTSDKDCICVNIGWMAQQQLHYPCNNFDVLKPFPIVCSAEKTIACLDL